MPGSYPQATHTDHRTGTESMPGRKYFGGFMPIQWNKRIRVAYTTAHPATITSRTGAAKIRALAMNSTLPAFLTNDSATGQPVRFTDDAGVVRVGMVVDSEYSFYFGGTYFVISEDDTGRRFRVLVLK